MAFDCCFCGDSRFKFFESIGLPSYDSILFEDDNLLITPDLVPVVMGHLLIYTKKHIACFGEANDEVIKSLQKAKNFINNYIYPDADVLYFEHGAVIEHTGGSCIDHAHLHALQSFEPINENYIDNFITGSGFVKTKKIEVTKSTLKNLYYNKQPYLYYEIRNASWAYRVETLPSQFYRLMFSPFMRFNYNWKISYNNPESKKMFLETLEYTKSKINKVIINEK
jgi:diadenosine tetraphosphate (Ap4A) HIT family hydrolase